MHKIFRKLGTSIKEVQMESSVQLEREVSWPAEVEQFQHHSGSLAGFCRARGVSPVRFRYWVEKLGKSKKGRAVSVSPFTTVKVEPKVSVVTLPDPRWLAEFILHLNGSGR